MLVKGSDNLTVGVTGIASIIVLLMVNLSLLFFDCSFGKIPLDVIMEE